jgi:hypothetical protein
MTILLEALLAAAALTAFSFLSQSGRIWSGSQLCPACAEEYSSPIVTTSAALLLTLFLLIFSCVFGAIPATPNSTSSDCTLIAWENPDAPPASGEVANAEGSEGVEADVGRS